MSVEALEPTAAVEETEPTAEAPAAPDPVAPSAPADEAVTTEPAAQASTRQRGPDGRFIKADGTQASEAEHAAMAAEPTSPPPPAPAPVTTQPFVVRGDGKRLEMPGSTLNDKGDLTVAAEHVSTYRQLIAEGLAHRGSWRQKEQALQQQIKEASAVEAAQKEKYHRASVLLFEKVTDPQWLQMAVADPREVQYLIRDLQLEIKAADMGAPKAPTPQPAVPDEENPQILEAANAVFVDYLEELLEGPQARTVFASEEDRKALRAELEALAGTFFVKREDGWALSEEAMEKAFTKELRLKQHERQQQLAAKKAEEFNAKRNQPPVAAPPVVSTKGPGVTGPPTQKQYASKEEYYKAMGLS